MSKAFTKEPDGGLDDEPEEGDEPLPPPSAGPRYISTAGYDKLNAELQHLWKVERPKVTAEVEAAAALGDRSENAEYIYGKRRLREIDRRLRFLKKRLESLTVVKVEPSKQDRVFFGATVTVRDEEGAELTYRLVGGDEIDLDKRWISIDSPVGKALLGKSVGEVVTVRRPKGEVDLEVVGLRYG